MKQKVYSIRDLKAGFWPPQIQVNDEIAKRNFAFTVTNNDGVIGFQPSDFDLYYIGEFEEQTGVMIPADIPQLVMNGSEAFYGKENK